MSPAPTHRRVFLLSHMRAYTSLVGHLLGSHPEIDGYYELHRGYALPDDLDRQRAQIAASDGLKPTGRWLFDKLLHNDYPLDLALPGLADAVVLTSLRPPAATLASILALFAQKPGDDLYATPAGATDYYIERLAALTAFATVHPGRTRYFDAMLVRDNPPRVLAALARWLDLASPLSPSYRTFSRTGVVGAGDSSAAIVAGRILRNAPDATGFSAGLKVAPAGLTVDLLDAAQQAYDTTRAVLIAHAAEAVVSEDARG